MLTALLLSFSLAAPGDVEAILATPIAELDAGAKAKLATAATAVFPGADLSKVRNFNCSRNLEDNTVSCDGMHMARVTESEFIDLSIEGKVSQAIAGAPLGFVDVKRHAPKKVAGVAAKIAIRDFVETVFTGVLIDIVHDFRCERSPQDDTVVICRCSYYDTVSPATYVTLVYTKSVVRPIKRVE